jgi:hypothetical protein
VHRFPVPAAVIPWFPRRGGLRPGPGIFAVGDVRSGSVKRAAAAIGEGSMAVRLVFDRLKSTGSTNAIELGPPA